MPVVIDGSNTPTAGGVGYGDGTELAFTSAGTSGQALLSAGSGVPTWGTPATATAATNLAGGSNGTVPYQSAAGTTQMLAVGTAGQVLQTNGAGAPTWVTPAGGNWILLQTNAFTSVLNVDFSNMSTTYDLYFLEGVITSTASKNTGIAYRFIDSASTVITSSYYNGNLWGGEENTTNIRWGANNSYGSCTYTSYDGTNKDISLNMYIMRSPNNETNGVYGTILSLYSTPIAPSQFSNGWGSNTSGSLNVGGIRIMGTRFDSTDFLTGTLRLWGWKKT
jgi:hypothetical protein